MIPAAAFKSDGNRSLVVGNCDIREGWFRARALHAATFDGTATAKVDMEGGRVCGKV
jgi:hypothetical protein